MALGPLEDFQGRRINNPYLDSGEKDDYILSG